MPTILELRNFRIVIETRDHVPAHVHCKGPGCIARIEIQTRAVMSNNGVSARDPKRLKELIENYEDVLMNEWKRIHG